MFEEGKEDLMEYCFRFMISKDMKLKFLNQKKIQIKNKSISAKKSAELLRTESNSLITLKEMVDFTRNNWNSSNQKLHLQSLKSGLLKGHHWHGAMPSFLHLSFQEKVRDYCKGKITLKEYLEIGGDIAKQELFIVITHDLCESKIIESFPEVIPSIANKSISDFIFRGIPFDLKNSGIPSGWTMEKARNNSLDFVKSLYAGADTQRLRKQAEKSINDWGLNRFYIIIDDGDKWLNSPEKLLDQLVVETQKLKTPLKFTIDGLNVICYIVFLK